jgi:hypothetical protein
MRYFWFSLGFSLVLVWFLGGGSLQPHKSFRTIHFLSGWPSCSAVLFTVRLACLCSEWMKSMGI